MNENMERIKTSVQDKPACCLLAALIVAVALAGGILSAFGHLAGTAAAFIAFSSFLAIGLCILLLHRYDKRADQAGAIRYGRILHGLMLHALFVAIAATVHATNGTQHATVSLVVSLALADAALAVTMIFMLADVRRNWDGEDITWVWAAPLPGVAVFALRFFDIEWMAWAVLVALAAAVIIYSLCKPRMHNGWCNLLFASVVAVFATVLLFSGQAPVIQMLLHILCLILTPVYALTTALLCAADPVRSTGASESRCMRNGQTVIYSHAAFNRSDRSKLDSDAEGDKALNDIMASIEMMSQEQEPDDPDASDCPLAEDDLELADLQKKIIAWKAEGESFSSAQSSEKKGRSILSEAACDTDAKKTLDAKRQNSELNCDMVFANAYCLLSLKYLSIAPLEAFSGISDAQIACMDELGAHTISDLASLPMFRVAEQIVRMASCEENKAVGN